MEQEEGRPAGRRHSGEVGGRKGMPVWQAGERTSRDLRAVVKQRRGPMTQALRSHTSEICPCPEDTGKREVPPGRYGE